jgi:hypothetical protein
MSEIRSSLELQDPAAVRGVFRRICSLRCCIAARIANGLKRRLTQPWLLDCAIRQGAVEHLIAAQKPERRGSQYLTVWLRGRDTGRGRAVRAATSDGPSTNSRPAKIRGVPFGTTP